MADYFTRVQATPGWAGILDSFLRFVDPRPGQRTLDVGCGPGALVRRLAEMGCQATGVDADPQMVQRAQELAAEVMPNAPALPDFRPGDATALPFPDGTFDLVTATNVLFLLPDPATGLREMARVCRPGGRVATLNPSPRLTRTAAEAHSETAGLRDFEAFSLINWGSIAERHRRFNRAEVEKMFTAAGLAAVAAVEKIGPGFALYAVGTRPAPVNSSTASGT